jgi:hypothetical protein
MLPELTIERVFRRELDSLPVPNEQLWLPIRTRRPSSIVAAAVAGAALVLALAAGALVREASSAATQPRVAVTATPSVLPTCAPPAFGANGRCVTLVPNAVRNPALGYNLVIPGDWREAQIPPGFEPFVRDNPRVAPSLTGPFLLERHVFTARSPREWVHVTSSAAPPWDLEVQIWDRQGRTAFEWSLTFGPCDRSVPNFGISACVDGIETIHGAPFVVTTVSTLHGSQTTSYYLERGDQMLILRYWTDPTVEPPAGVTEATLESIVRSIGLV